MYKAESFRKDLYFILKARKEVISQFYKLYTSIDVKPEVSLPMIS